MTIATKAATNRRWQLVASRLFACSDGRGGCDNCPHLRQCRALQKEYDRVDLTAGELEEFYSQFQQIVEG